MEPIKVQNDLTWKKEVFKPIHSGHVGIYSCGPTVYWYQHIGNMRTYVSNDLIKRVFLYNNYKVKHVINVTDVGHLTSDQDVGEDKIEKAAKKEKKTAEEIAKYYFKVFDMDLRKLNVLEPTVWAWATEHIKDMINLIKILEKKGYTYKTSDGVYFDTMKFPDYGQMARLNPEKLIVGKRVDIGEKRNPRDFALWKFSEHPGERQQEWKSPWGVGYPGWHIECSAMATKYLGKQFDIHTGGMEHIPVHHTNEIAQSEAAFGKKPWVRYWIHFAWLLFKGEKISKSSGGLFTIDQLEEKGFDSLAFRYLCLTKSYRKPLNFTIEILQSSQTAYQRLKNIVAKLKESGSKLRKNKKNIELAKAQFLKIINDDFNSSQALAYLWDLLRDDKLNDAEKYELAIDFDKIFGLDLDKQEEFKVPKGVERLVNDREKAREKKDWKKSDEIRAKIKKLGYVLEDTEKGVVVKKGEKES